MQVAAVAPQILIVEPHQSGLAIMARRLGEAGYGVVACRHAGEAMTELRRSPVDLLLAELRMEPTSGIELTRRVRAEGHLPDLPIILINGRSDREGACAGLTAGADDIVTKPFDFDLLIARIARAINRSRGVGELRQDKATLDARVITRAIELGEMRAAYEASEAERRRLAAMLRLPD